MGLNTYTSTQSYDILLFHAHIILLSNALSRKPRSCDAAAAHVNLGWSGARAREQTTTPPSRTEWHCGVRCQSYTSVVSRRILTDDIGAGWPPASKRMAKEQHTCSDPQRQILIRWEDHTHTQFNWLRNINKTGYA